MRLLLHVHTFTLYTARLHSYGCDVGLPRLRPVTLVQLTLRVYTPPRLVTAVGLRLRVVSRLVYVTFCHTVAVTLPVRGCLGYVTYAHCVTPCGSVGYGCARFGCLRAFSFALVTTLRFTLRYHTVYTFGWVTFTVDFYTPHTFVCSLRLRYTLVVTHTRLVGLVCYTRTTRLVTHLVASFGYVLRWYVYVYVRGYTRLHVPPLWLLPVDCTFTLAVVYGYVYTICCARFAFTRFGYARLHVYGYIHIARSVVPLRYPARTPHAHARLVLVDYGFWLIAVWLFTLIDLVDCVCGYVCLHYVLRCYARLIPVWLSRVCCARVYTFYVCRFALNAFYAHVGLHTFTRLRTSVDSFTLLRGWFGFTVTQLVGCLQFARSRTRWLRTLVTHVTLRLHVVWLLIITFYVGYPVCVARYGYARFTFVGCPVGYVYTFTARLRVPHGYVWID